MQKELYLIRHAKSSWKETGISDHDRQLNKRGKHDAPLMAKILKNAGVIPDILLSSTAVRAKKTAFEFADCFGIGKKDVVLSEELYLADEGEILEHVRSLKEKVRTAFLFAHNPGITDFANILCNTSILNIPTCGVYHARILTDTWSKVEPGSGSFISLDFPKKHYPES